MIENELGFVFLFQSFLRDFIRRPDELAQHRLAANYLGVVSDVGRVGQTVSEVGDEADAADRFERVFFLEFFADQNRIDLGAPLEERGQGNKHAPVRRHIKIFGPQQLYCLTDETVVENDAAENSALSFSAVWQRTLKRLLADGIRSGHRIKDWLS